MTIGVLDSGIGGTSILHGLEQALPQHRYIYQSDEKNFPYSTKSDTELKNIAVNNVRTLLEQGAQLIVVACNTLTVSSLAHLRQTFPTIPFVGTVPAIKKAAEELPADSNIIVLSTIHTAHSPYLHNLIEKFTQGQQFIIVGTTELVTAIEEHDTDWSLEILRQLLEKRIQETHIDGLVIGCTHFSLVEEQIRSIIPYPVRLFDSIDGVAAQVKNLLKTI